MTRVGLSVVSRVLDDALSAGHLLARSSYSDAVSARLTVPGGAVVMHSADLTVSVSRVVSLDGLS